MPGSISGPGLSSQYDVPLPERMPALVVPDGVQPIFSWTLTDPTGHPVDLTPYDAGGGVVPCALRMVDATGLGNRYRVDVTGTVGGPVTGPIDLTALCGPGIFRAQVAALDGNAVPSVINTLYLVVESSLWSANDLSGPPNIAELRLHLRDSSPAESRLLDVRQFDDAEVARCLVSVVQYWNDDLPPGFLFSTQNYPFRDLWRRGTIAGLQKLAAEWYRKNRLDNAAGGITVSDLNKADEYDRQADQGWQSFMADSRSRKVSLNMEAAYGEISSPYRYTSRFAW